MNSYGKCRITLFIILLFMASLPNRLNGAEIDTLISQLKSNKTSVRITAARELGKLGDKQAVEPLIACLNDKSVKVGIARAAAAKALAEIGDHRAVESLIASLSDETLNDLSRAAMPKALAKIGDPKTVDALIAYLNDKGDEDFHTCPAVTKTLGELGDPRAIPALGELLKSVKVHLHRHVIDAMIAINDPVAAPYLSDYISSRNTRGFGADRAVKALASLGGKDSVEHLIIAVKEGDSWASRQAAKELAKIGQPAAGPLISLLEELNAGSDRREEHNF